MQQVKTLMGNDKQADELDALINVRAKGDTSRFLFTEQRKKLQELKGFNDDYTDIVDYIIRCTHKIWEEHGIGRIYDHYLSNISITTSDGLSYGRDAVVSASTLVMSAFSDLRLYGDDVIWYKDDQDQFHTSHRITWTGRNTGHSLYGPPTNRRIQRFGIANCLVRENYIIEEWIARDEMSLILQLGLDPWQMAAQFHDPERESMSFSTLGEPEMQRGQLMPIPKRLDDSCTITEYIESFYHDVWNVRLLNKIRSFCSDSYQFYGPSGRNLYGRGNYTAYILSLLSMFPDLHMSVDHVYYNGSAEEECRIAVRWSFEGTHAQNGIYGPPTGKRVRIMGISHLHMVKGILCKEWTAFDEFSLYKQIYTAEIHGAAGTVGGGR